MNRNDMTHRDALAFLASFPEDHPVFAWDEMDSSRPNIDTTYLVWNEDKYDVRPYGKILVLTYHNGSGDEAEFDNVRSVERGNIWDVVHPTDFQDPLPVVKTVGWLRDLLMCFVTDED